MNGWGARCQAGLGDPPPEVARSPFPAACSSASLPPPQALSRSMQPLLTAENRARLPAPCPAPPARLGPPRSSRRNEKEFAAEAFTPGQGLRRERLVGPKLPSREEGRMIGKPKSPLRAGPRGLKGTKGLPPTAGERRSGTKNFPAGEGVRGKSLRFWGGIVGLWGESCPARSAGSELTSQHACALTWEGGQVAVQTGLAGSRPLDKRRLFAGQGGQPGGSFPNM